eukprot:11160330-Lingulodinium_polyedra.AAC.1
MPRSSTSHPETETDLSPVASMTATASGTDGNADKNAERRRTPKDAACCARGPNWLNGPAQWNDHK